MSDKIMDETKRSVLLAAYSAHIQSCQNLTKYDAIHSTELRCLLVFLFVLVGCLTVGLKLENACLTWVAIQFIFSIWSKFSQFYNRFEVDRTRKNLEDIIKTLL